LVGVSKLLIFGGGDDGRVYNDCYILDVETMSWSRPITKGTSPVKQKKERKKQRNNNELKKQQKMK